MRQFAKSSVEKSLSHGLKARWKETLSQPRRWRRGLDLWYRAKRWCPCKTLWILSFQGTCCVVKLIGILWHQQSSKLLGFLHHLFWITSSLLCPYCSLQEPKRIELVSEESIQSFFCIKSLFQSLLLLCFLRFWILHCEACQWSSHRTRCCHSKQWRLFSHRMYLVVNQVWPQEVILSHRLPFLVHWVRLGQLMSAWCRIDLT